MKIAITGGAGFIGSHVTKAYLDAGHDVLIIDSLVNGSQKAIDPRARFYQMDIRDGKLHSLLQKERPDIVSHHAAQRHQYIQPLEEQSLTDADVHVRGLLNVLDGCISASVASFIFASGGNSLYGRVDSARQVPTVKEDAPLCPLRPYDISKVAGEWYVRYYTRQHGLTHTILRYADVFGETDCDLAQHPLTYFVRMLLEGRRPIIRGASEEMRDHIFIDDVVRANMRILEQGKNQTFHISSGQGYTQKQLFHTVANILQAKVEPVYISNSLIEASSTVLDNTQVWRALGWRPEINFMCGVQLAIDRLREQLGQTLTLNEVKAYRTLAPALV